MSGWVLIGAPWDCSGTGRGEERAPGALRRAGIGRLAGADAGDAATVIDSRRRDEATGVLALPETIAAARALATMLATVLASHPGRRPLVVGGDCSLLLGVFAGATGRTGLWMLDGHPDYVDGPSSETGETADLELAVLTGDGPPGLTGDVPMVAARHVALIGHRTEGLDEASRSELARLPSGMLTIDAGAVRDDPRGAGARAAAWAEPMPMWLHIDVDVLDPAAMPAVTYPQPGGPGFDQLAAVLAPLAASPRLAGVSIADFRPDLDPDGRHAEALISLLDRAIFAADRL